MPKTSGETFAFADDTPSPKQPQGPSPAQQLLDWCQRWPQPSFGLRDVRNFGPNFSHHTMKDPKNAREAVEILVRNKWLIPIQPLWGNTPRWEIVRKPIARPVVDS